MLPCQSCGLHAQADELPATELAAAGRTAAASTQDNALLQERPPGSLHHPSDGASTSGPQSRPQNLSEPTRHSHQSSKPSAQSSPQQHNRHADSSSTSSSSSSDECSDSSASLPSHIDWDQDAGSGRNAAEGDSDNADRQNDSTNISSDPYIVLSVRLKTGKVRLSHGSTLHFGTIQYDKQSLSTSAKPQRPLCGLCESVA